MEGTFSKPGPVVVMGYPYSGSHHLQRLLSGHGSLACTEGTGLMPLCKMAVSTWRQVEEHDGPPSALAITSIRALADCVITSVLARTGKTRWCELAFGHPDAADIFLWVYPSAKLVCVHRNCLDVIAEGIDASPWGLAGSHMEPFAAEFPGNTVATAAAYWAARSRALLEFERSHPGASLRLRYEDLLDGPDEALARVCSFAGLELPGPSARDAGNETSAATTSLDIPIERIPKRLAESVNDLMHEIGYKPLI
jgi:hypothetical protein